MAVRGLFHAPSAQDTKSGDRPKDRIPMGMSAAFYRTLAAYHRAGIPWPEAVESAGGVKGGPTGVASRLRGGAALADALAEHTDPVEAALLRAGEAAGALEGTLERIAETKEDDARNRKERWSAVAYPVLLAHAAAVLMPIPDLLQQNYGRALFWAALILVPVWGWLLAMHKLDSGRSWSRERPLPTWGPFRNIVDEADARSLRAFAACHDAGVPILTALTLAQRVSPGSRAGQDFGRALVLAQAGGALDPAWQSLPPESAGALRAGAEVGELGVTASRLADSLTFDVAMRRKRSGALLPIVIMLIVGGVVAWRVIDFWGGIYSNLPGM